MKGTSDRWDNHAISVLNFDVDDQPYSAYRKANVFALHNESNRRLHVTTRYSEWSKIVADLFDFRLMLPTHSEQLAQATPPYLFLPYYMDQDGSWLQQWNSFERLTAFTDWKKPLTAYVTGQRPNGYYVAKFQEAKAKTMAGSLEKELGVVRVALDRVKKTLPRSVMQLDTRAFKQEIAELIKTATQLKNEQESLRKKAFDNAAERESLASQIGMAHTALRELEGDLKYLTDGDAAATLTCPTCGSIHENGFPVRLELIDDAVTMRKVIAELEADQRAAQEKLAEIEGNLVRVKHKIMDIDKVLQSKKGMLRLQDVVVSQSTEIVSSAFRKDLDSLTDNLGKAQGVVTAMKEKVAQFDLPERTKEINGLYSERIQFFASELEVHDLRDDIKKKPDARVTASGSALPRSLLAYQYAILHTAREKGDAKRFPIVIDSPNQQGQDAQHLRQMLNFIIKHTPKDQQLILAVEDMPTDFQFSGEAIFLTEPFNLLRKQEYDLALDALGELVAAVVNQSSEVLQ
jgi:predicted nuclease with TOPRIM domain